MRHSDLINPADLHFSKFKTFTGSPTLIVPDFADQLFAATDTNKIYRANGTAQGSLIELAPQTSGTGGTGSTNYTLVSTFAGSPTLIVPDFIDQLFAATDTNKIYRATGTTQGALVELSPTVNTQQALVQASGYPYYLPEFIGQKYFDQETSVLFFAKGLNNVADWRPVYEDMEIAINISNPEGTGSTLFNLYYSAEEPTDGFNFDFVVAFNLPFGTTYGLRAIQQAGIGFYAIAPTIADATIPICTTGYKEQALGNRSIISTTTIPGSLTANGQRISSNILAFREFPKRMTDAGQPYSIDFYVG